MSQNKKSILTPLIVATCIVVVGIVAGTTDARASGFGEPVGTIYLSGSPTEYFPFVQAGSFTPFEFYIVAEVDYSDIGAGQQNLTNGISAWEMAVSIPADIIITQAVLNPANAENLGSNVNWLVGLGLTFTASTSPILLATYTGLITNPATPVDLVLRVGGADPSIFDPAVPGFLDGEVSGECFLPDGTTPAKCKRPFAGARGMLVNCVVECHEFCRWVRCDPIVESSWGTLKATFKN